jgi:hypothetical protein
MLRFVVHTAHRLTLLPYVEGWAGPFASHIELVGYDELFRASRLPLCTHVFTDIDRLTAVQREDAAVVWNALAQAPSPVKLLNHPLRAMRRYELLRVLHERRFNDFDVYRLTEARTPLRFPVFLRQADDHLGPESALLHSPGELESALDGMAEQCRCRENRLAVEYCAEPAADGMFRKYAAFYVDGEVIPRHLLCSRDWLVKGGSKVVNDDVSAEEARFLESNPDSERIAEIFRIARIDYGRIDYGWAKGKLQTYEINLNPTIINAGPLDPTRKKMEVTRELTKAFQRLEAQSPDGIGLRPRLFKLAAPPKGWRARLASRVVQKLLGRQLRAPV